MATYKPPANLSKTYLDRPPPNWKELTTKVGAAVKAVDAAAKKFPPAIPPDEATAYVNIRPMPKFPKEEVVSAKTPVEVTAIRQQNARHLHNWAAVHNPGALPPDGAEREWLRDQWHKEKKKKAAAAANAKAVPGGPAAGVAVMGVATKTIVENEKKAVDRIRKENAAWLKGSEVAKEAAPLLAAKSLKDKERSPAGGAAKKDWDADLLTAVHKALKDPKNVNYGINHCALASSGTFGHLGLDKDPILKGVFAHLKKRPDPSVAYLAKLLKLPAPPPAWNPATEAAAITGIRERNAKWLKSVGAEGAELGAKAEKRGDVLDMAKKKFPEYEKPSALGACGGQIKTAPTNTWGPTPPAATPATLKKAREASAQALWPAPAPALKKTQDTELARIHKECEAWDASAEAGGRYTDQFVAAHDPQPVCYYDGVPAALVTL